MAATQRPLSHRPCRGLLDAVGCPSRRLRSRPATASFERCAAAAEQRSSG